MLVRIVKLSIEEKYIEEFKSNFNNQKKLIRNFSGCQFLELYQEKNSQNIFFTYSYWNNEEDLNSYRNSELFKGIWSKTKPMFNAKPEAWSVDKLESLP